VRKRFVAGNWKMNTTKADGIALAKAIVDGVSDDSVDVAICVPSVYLDAIIAATEGKIAVGAQNMYFEETGAYTGEVSGLMLKDLGCTYVVLGHSERRHVFGESSAEISKKVHKALELGLKPIVCVGELLDERETGKTRDVIGEQVLGSLAGITAQQLESVVIAYEPVWAIGTGKVASPLQAVEAHRHVREFIAHRFGNTAAESIRIQYGGSVKPDNAGDLLSQEEIDGALVGGASLKADSFLGIISAAKS